MCKPNCYQWFCRGLAPVQMLNPIRIKGLRGKELGGLERGTMTVTKIVSRNRWGKGELNERNPPGHRWMNHLGQLLSAGSKIGFCR